MELPTLQHYEMTDAALRSIQLLGDDNAKLVMTLDCPVLGWRWKRLVPVLLRNFWFDDIVMDYHVRLSFLDVQQLQLSGGFAQSNQRSLCGKVFRDDAPTLLRMDFVRTTQDRGRAHLEFAQGSIDFEFASCIQREQSHQPVTRYAT